ncbi:MAG: hypothetical protein LBH42_04680 [Treponema sp.]|jgi:hypothetical protein|nr:hypothetical protein [Treponema sp.]
MSNNGKAGHGRGNNRKRPFRRRENDNDTWQKGDFSGWGSSRQVKRSESGQDQGKNPGRSSENQTNQTNQNKSGKKSGDRPERGPYFERPKWIPPKLSTNPLPVSDCPWCGKPIRDMSSAIADKDTGVPVHFDCVISRITFGEKLEKGDTVSYIGGGRFGIVCLGSSSRDSHGKVSDSVQNRDFSIKKIIEWENKDKRSDWRSAICEHYSVT